MADRYWVGGTGTWDGSNTTNWSTSSGGSGGASVPTSADNVIFDNGSDAGANYAVTISGTRVCADFTVASQDFVMTLSGTATPVLQMHGSVSVNPVTSGRFVGSGVIAMQFLGSGSLTISVTNTSPANQLTAGSCTFNNSGGTWTLNSGFNVVGAGLTVSTGTLALSSNQLTYSGSTALAVNGGTLNFGSGTLLASAAFTIIFAASTVIAGTGTLTCSTNTALTFNGNGNTFYQVTLGGASSTIITINGANTYTNLILGGTVTVMREVRLSANQTVTGALNFSGASPTSNPHDRRTFIKSSVYGTQRTISIATAQNVQTLDFEDIAITGAASPISGSSLSNRLGNSGITFDAAKTVYWVGGTGNWTSNASTRWAATSGGGAAVTNYPLAQDTVVIDDSSGTGTLTVDVPGGVGTAQAVGTLDCSARTLGTFTINVDSGGLGFYIYKDFKASTAITNFSGVNVYLATRSTGAITSNGKTIAFSFVVKALGGTVSLIDALSCSGPSGISLQAGTFALNGNNCTVSGGGFGTSGTASKTLALGSNDLICSNSGFAFIASGSNLSVTGTGKIRMTSASAKTFTGGGFTYPHLENGGAGALTISGSNTFTTISNSVQPTTFSFTSGTTQTVTNFSVSGTAGNLVTITSTAAGNATLSKASGTVVVSFCSITKSTATGGATWYALTSDGNVNAGSNSGWIFAPSANGLFFGSNF